MRWGNNQGYLRVTVDSTFASDNYAYKGLTETVGFTCSMITVVRQKATVLASLAVSLLSLSCL